MKKLEINEKLRKYELKLEKEYSFVLDSFADELDILGDMIHTSLTESMVDSVWKKGKMIYRSFKA